MIKSLFKFPSLLGSKVKETLTRPAVSFPPAHYSNPINDNDVLYICYVYNKLCIYINGKKELGVCRARKDEMKKWRELAEFGLGWQRRRLRRLRDGQSRSRT